LKPAFYEISSWKKRNAGLCPGTGADGPREITGRSIRDPRVIAAMQKIPRHIFMPEALRGQSYGDSALPIGEGQMISQPYIVAYMSEALGLQGHERVLEIGTGSGYQTAVLSRLGGRIYSVERIRSLLEQARKVLDLLECRNVITRLFDGSYGWKDEGPFDAILVTAAAPAVPRPLMEQLKVGGRMIVPIGSRDSQRLVRFHRGPRGLQEEELQECHFVALVGEHGWEKTPKRNVS
jgi:protein-L-isoaspartate(D-aspartate) O-methyltransferase